MVEHSVAMKRLPVASLLLASLGGAPAGAQETPATRWRMLEGVPEPALRYALLLPEDFDAAREWPVLLALPPGGQDEDMVEKGLELYFEGEARKRGWVVVSPAAPEGTSFVGGAEARLPALIDAVAREVHPEGGKFHLAGVSNGGRAAFRAATLDPARFLSLTVLPGAPTEEDRARLDRLAGLPIALFVGAEDEDWREAAFEAAEALEAAGAKDVELEVREGEGHVLAPEVGARVFDRLEALRAASSGKATRAEPFFDWTELEFAPEVHAARRRRLAERLAASGGGVFLTPSREGTSSGETFRQTDDFLYFTGLELPRSILAVEAHDGRATLFVPERDARFENPGRPNDFPGRRLATDPTLARVSGIEAVLPSSALEAALAGWVESGRSLWLDAGGSAFPAEDPADPFVLRDETRSFEHFLRARFPAARIANAFPEVARLRMVKGPEEVERIRRACSVTAAAVREAARSIRPGVDERTLEGVLEAAYKAGGAQRPAFDSIVKSGPNSLWPWRLLAAHYDRRNRAMAAGELVILDVGCELDHYASDVGRTFPVSGRFTPEQAERLRRVTAIADELFAAVRPGVTLAELRALAEARSSPEERTHMQTGSFFGHHLGLDAGDASLFDAPLEAGMVFTIEPWYYDHERGLAVFVEDVVLVTPTGAENLTAELPRTPEDLARCVGGG